MTRAALTARRLLVALFCARLLAAPVRTNDGVVLCPAGQRPDGQGRCVPVVCPPGTVTAFPAFAACVPCHAGGYANAQGTLCLACEDGISASGSTKCEACEGVFFNLQPDAPHERCEITAVSILTPVKFFLCLLGLFQLLAMARIYCLEVTDVSLQSGQTVISTLGRHFLRTSRGGRVDVPRVELQGTGVRGLDLAEFQVKVLGKEQLVLIHLEGKVEHWASSMGQLRLHFPQTLWQIRFLHTPLLAWVLLFLASAIAVGFGVTKLSILLSLSSAFLLSTILVSAGQKQRTPVALKRQQFLRLHSQLQPCERGPLRAMKLEKMKTFHEFFEMFIRDRSMTYVCENLVKPLTFAVQHSFAELVGSTPTPVQWFVSHFWGSAFRHFSETVQKHAAQVALEPDSVAYWVCTFSNNQWAVDDELGHGETLQLSQNPSFEGLLLCTPSGVLQDGRAGTDVAMEVARKLSQLDLRDAEATSQKDKELIESEVLRTVGGFEEINRFVRGSIRNSLLSMHMHFETEFQELLRTLSSCLPEDQENTVLMRAKTFH